MSDVTVILNGYKRKKQLNEQLDAIRNQSVKVESVMLLHSKKGQHDMDRKGNRPSEKQHIA